MEQQSNTGRLVAIIVVAAAFGFAGLIGCGCLASYMTSSLIAQNKEEVLVLRVKERIPQWTTIQDPRAVFEPTSMLKKAAPANLIIPGPDWEKSLRGRRTRVAIDKEEVLTEDLLAKAGTE